MLYFSDGANVTPANAIIIFLSLPAGSGMNPGDKSHPLTQKILEHQRRVAKGYACPFCTEVYHQEQTLWDHALKNHLNLLGDLGSTEMANAMQKKVRQQALQKAYVDFCTTSASRLPKISFPIQTSLLTLEAGKIRQSPKSSHHHQLILLKWRPSPIRKILDSSPGTK